MERRTLTRHDKESGSVFRVLRRFLLRTGAAKIEEGERVAEGYTNKQRRVDRDVARLSPRMWIIPPCPFFFKDNRPLAPWSSYSRLL
jgi:hypothetical protein